MIVYQITEHDGIPGARLSKPGHFTNLPHDDEASAREAARIDAGGSPFIIDRERFPHPPFRKR